MSMNIIIYSLLISDTKTGTLFNLHEFTQDTDFPASETQNFYSVDKVFRAIQTQYTNTSILVLFILIKLH